MPNELIRNAEARARRKELENFQRALDTQWINNRMEDGRMGRCMALIKKEAEMEKEYQERTDHAGIVNNRAKREAALASEVAKVHHDEVVELKRRHMLREQDPELRKLILKLEAGYTCRDLQQQILNNDYRRLQEKAEENRAYQMLQASLSLDKASLEKEELAQRKEAAKYMRDIQQQLVDRQRARQCSYEDALIEQKMLDDVMRTIADEDQRELKKKRDLTEKTRKEMETFQQARDAWRVKQRTLAIQEEEEIEKQKQAVSDRMASIVAERERQHRVKEEINAKICAKILADEEEREDRNNIIKALQEQELIEKQVQNDKKESEKVDFSKVNTKTDLLAQIEKKRKEREQERRSDLEFLKESQKMTSSEDARRVEKERVHKQKAIQHGIDLKRQIQENARKRENARRDEDARNMAVFGYGNKWDAEVSKERSKIVEEHVPKILGFIQAGVIGKEDLPAVRTGANRFEQLKSLDIESLANAAEVKRHPKCNAMCKILRDY